MAKIIFFSGAGVSADSGISTFRDSDGLWENYKIEEICQAGCLSWNREATLSFYDARREDLKDKKPNLAHILISELKNEYPKEIAVITQNIDDMFERAGCKGVIHLHGFLQELRCESCGFIKNIGYTKQYREEKCPTCKEYLRPNIVFFAEAAPMYEKLYAELEDCEVFVCIGTSGAVLNIDMLSQWAKYKILNNLEPSNLIDERYFDEVYYEKASVAITKIISSVKQFLPKH